eukprot:4791447-Pyramimonas_sp.AAC.1
MFDQPAREEEGIRRRGLEAMGDPLEVFTLCHRCSGSSGGQALGKSVMLATYSLAALLAGPVMPVPSAPNFVLCPKIAAHIGQNVSLTVGRSVPPGAKEGPNGLEKRPRDPK